MRYLIWFLLIVEISMTSAQDYEPGTFPFTLDKTTFYISADSSSFQQNDFILGWQWAHGGKISKALNVNQGHVNRGFVLDSLTTSTNLIVNSFGNTHCQGGEVLNGRGIQYEPTLEIDSINPEDLVLRLGDTTRSVFGFRHRRGRVITDSTDENFNRRIFEGDSLYNQVILSDPWPNNELYEEGYNEYNDIAEEYLGRTLHFSINLRRDDSLIDNAEILKIELPYELYGGDSNNIQFRNVPKGGINDTLPYCRGTIRDTTIAAPGTRMLIITRDMIPPNNKDITISAFFKVNGDTINYHNPQIKSDYVTYNTSEIDKIGIKITYIDPEYKKLMIDWVRLETPHTQKLLRGEYDIAITDAVQDDIETFYDTSYTNNGHRLFRYNTHIEGHLYNWISEKYFNKLIGNIATGEVNTYYPKLYEYYVNPPDRWLCDFSTNTWISAPYSRRIYSHGDPLNEARTIGVINGYCGMKDSTIAETDSAISHYETYTRIDNNYLPITYFIDYPNDISKYEEAIFYHGNKWKLSSLLNTENNLYYAFFRDKAAGSLFSDKFWWCQNQIHINWSTLTNFDPNDETLSTLITNFRPLTGEEYRVLTNIPLILGAKGLLYDGAFTNGLSSSKSKTGIYDYTCISPEEIKDTIEAWDDYRFLRSDSAGADYIKNDDEIFEIDERIYSFDDLAQYMNRPKDKIYMGRKSLRLEMKKQHDWIEAVGSTLMNLRLQCYYGKGLKKWYLQHSKYSDSLINNYIDLDYIRTKHPSSFFIEGNSAYNYEDSSFYDISILSDSETDSNMNNTFYVGIVNRRTSPLVLTDGSYKFYSTADFDDRVNGNDNTKLWGGYEDVEYWKDLWWQREGCREITIPFNYRKDGVDSNDYCLLKITELGNDLYSSDTIKWWWRSPEFHQTVDTTIGQDSDISLKFLPGEGKILKVEILSPPKDISGHLDHSNQNKLIAYPYYDSTRITDSLFYHLVYFKEDTVITPTPKVINQVYYCRSKILGKDTDYENIEWEREICISDTIDLSGSILDSISCDYPSLVVRKDISGIVKAYIVYSCEGTEEVVQDRIVETILEVNDIDASKIIDAQGEIIGLYNTDSTRNRHEWGNPVINASYRMNYYAWSDSLNGIFVGCKEPEITGRIDNNGIGNDTIYLSWNNDNIYTKHPSFNSYSHIDSTEDNCALVWQESKSGGDFNQIYYTRIRFYLDTLRSYFPSTPGPYAVVDGSYDFNYDSSIVKLTGVDSDANCEYPVVSRKLGKYNFTNQTPDNYRPNRQDVILWQEDYSWIFISIPLENILIGSRSIKFHDNSNTANLWDINSEKRIVSFFADLTHPTVNFGLPFFAIRGLPTGPGRKVKFCPEDFAVDFNYGGNGLGDWITQLPIGTHSILYNGDFADCAMYYLDPIATGTLPHLSQFPSVNDELWKNRQVFEANTNAPPDIYTSAKGFYRTNDNEIIAEPLFGYRVINDSLKANYMVSLPKVDESYLEIQLPYQEVEDADFGNYYIQVKKDTLFSEYFDVEESSILEFKCMGLDTTMFHLEIEKKDPNQFTNIPLPEIISDTAGILRIYLINGDGSDYRLLFINGDITNGYYTEEIYLGGLPVNDTLSSRTKANNRLIIDLNGQSYQSVDGNRIKLNVYPNPANDKIFASAYYPVSYYTTTERNNSILIKLCSSVGEIYYEQEVKPGETIVIPTHDLSQGIYFLRAYENFSNFRKEIVSPTTEPIIISR